MKVYTRSIGDMYTYKRASTVGQQSQTGSFFESFGRREIDGPGVGQPRQSPIERTFYRQQQQTITEDMQYLSYSLRYEVSLLELTTALQQTIVVQKSATIPDTHANANMIVPCLPAGANMATSWIFRAICAKSLALL